MARMPTYEELQDALTNCLDDLNAWASSGPEGFTKDERKRAAGYQRILDRATGATQAATTKPRAAVTLRLPPSLHHRIADLAAHDGVSLNDWVAAKLDAETVP